MTVVPFPALRLARSVTDVPKISDEDKLYAKRLGPVLRTLREGASKTQAMVEEDLSLAEGTLGRWERGDHAPKGYNFGRLFRYYEPWGAELNDFLDPPAIMVVNPLRDRLAAKRPGPLLDVAAAVDTRLPELADEVRARGRIRSVPQAGRPTSPPKRSSARARQAT